MRLFSLLSIAVAWAQPRGPFPDEVRGEEDVGDTGGIDESDLSPCSGGPTVQLPEAPSLWIRWSGDRAWGTRELVDLLTSTAEAMRWLAPNADPLVVGDLSAKGGGPLYGHRSHRDGRDADIGLYHGAGKQHPNDFKDIPPSELDVRTTWMLLLAMLDTGMVERVLLDRSLIAAVRRHAVSEGELSAAEAAELFPPEGSPATWNRTGVVQHAPHHKNHLHVRVRCAGD